MLGVSDVPKRPARQAQNSSNLRFRRIADIQKQRLRQPAQWNEFESPERGFWPQLEFVLSSFF